MDRTISQRVHFIGMSCSSRSTARRRSSFGSVEALAMPLRSGTLKIVKAAEALATPIAGLGGPHCVRR